MTKPADLLARADTVAQVLVADVAHPEPTESDVAHLTRALRIRPDEKVSVVDGRGHWSIARWRGEGTLELDGDVRYEEASSPVLTVAFAVLKGDNSEWVVQKLTEIGIDRIVPLAAERTIVRWNADKAARNVERWRRVAHEAAMQSRRLRVPEVADLEPARGFFAAAPGPWALAQPGGDPLTQAVNTVAVGPEGGWSPGELECADRTLDLGETVLRAETAAVVAGTLLAAGRRSAVA